MAAAVGGHVIGLPRVDFAVIAKDNAIRLWARAFDKASS